MDEDKNEVEQALVLCRERKPMGILFLGGNPSNFKEKYEQIEVPGVLITNCGKELPFENLSSVSVDDIAAAKKALYTGHIGDGKIFVYNVDKVVKVPTGEEDFEALQDVE